MQKMFLFIITIDGLVEISHACRSARLFDFPFACRFVSYRALMQLSGGRRVCNAYYTVLRKQPHLLHRFYTEHSTVTYCEPGIEPQVIGTQQVCDAIQYRVLHASRHEYREGPVASLAQMYTLHLSRTIFRQCFTCVPDTL